MGQMQFGSSNPALSADTFRKALALAGEEKMTVMGTVHKTGLCLLIALLTASYTWGMNPQDGMLMPLMFTGMIGGLITAFVIIFKPHMAPTLAPVYAALEGLLLGAISGLFELQYPGLVSQALISTFGVLGAMLFAYQTKLIQVTERFKMGVFAATAGIAIFYLFSMVMSFFGSSPSFMVSSSPMSIGFSVIVVIVAALNLVLDFDFIESGAKAGAPKYMEWYGAFGLMVTLVWLYMEMLRLLSKLRDR